MTESNHPWHGSTCSDPCSHRSDYYIITWAHTHLQLSLHFYLIKHLQRHDCINDTGCTGVEQLELDYGDPQLKTNMGHVWKVQASCPFPSSHVPRSGPLAQTSTILRIGLHFDLKYTPVKFVPGSSFTKRAQKTHEHLAKHWELLVWCPATKQVSSISI